MAEAILKAELAKINRNDCRVGSAGIGALVGHKADAAASELMTAKGLDISQHRASQLNEDMIRKADLIIAMEARHKWAIESREPSAKGKVFRLGEWNGYDIPDPYQKDWEFFESVLTLIEQGVTQWIKKI
jgi:protein-tyrosine phosphatase